MDVSMGPENTAIDKNHFCHWRLIARRTEEQENCDVVQEAYRPGHLFLQFVYVHRFICKRGDSSIDGR